VPDLSGTMASRRMDKGGSEHQVALQRLEDALIALDEELDRLNDRLAQFIRPLQASLDLNIELCESRDLIGDIREWDAYWPRTSVGSIVEMATASEQATQDIQGLQASGRPGKQFAQPAIVEAAKQLKDLNKHLHSVRQELYADVAQSIFLDAENDSLSRTDASPNSGDDNSGFGQARREEAAAFAEHVTRYYQGSLSAWKRYKASALKDIMLPLGLALIFLVTVVWRTFDGPSPFHRDTPYLLVDFPMLLFIFWVWQTYSGDIRFSRRAKAQAEFLFAVSDQISKGGSLLRSREFVNLAIFAAQHRDDMELGPDCYKSKTEELRALIARTSESRTPPTAHAPN
jgi:hypothetical protein